MGRWLWLFGVAAALGVFADIGHSLSGAWSYVPQMGWPWIALAVLWGRQGRSGPAAGGLGAASIVLGLSAYTGFKAFAYGYDSVANFLTGAGPLWVVLALLVGAPAGWSGRWLTDHKLSGLPLGLLAGSALAESFVWLVLHDLSSAGRTAATAEGLAGCVVLLGALVAKVSEAKALVVWTMVWAIVGVSGGYVLRQLPL